MAGMPFSEGKCITGLRISEVKSGRKNLLNVPLPGRAPDEGLDDCIAKAIRENPHLSTRRIVKALNISSTTVRNHLTKSLGTK
jgi:predicted HTH transcriptional regulator